MLIVASCSVCITSFLQLIILEINECSDHSTDLLFFSSLKTTHPMNAGDLELGAVLPLISNPPVSLGLSRSQISIIINN